MWLCSTRAPPRDYDTAVLRKRMRQTLRWSVQTWDPAPGWETAQARKQAGMQVGRERTAKQDCCSCSAKRAGPVATMLEAWECRGARYGSWTVSRHLCGRERKWEGLVEVNCGTGVVMSRCGLNAMGVQGESAGKAEVCLDSDSKLCCTRPGSIHRFFCWKLCWSVQRVEETSRSSALPETTIAVRTYSKGIGDH